MNQIKREIFRFIVSGICAVCTDMLFYYLFSMFINISIAKAISFMMGTITAYLMNKCYTFEQKEKNTKEMISFMCLYAFTLCVNVAVNKLSFVVLPLVLSYIGQHEEYQIIKFIAFLLATGTSTVLNFIGQKFWVFRRKVV